MAQAYTPRQVRALIKKIVKQRESPRPQAAGRALNEVLVDLANGGTHACVAYRGAGTKEVCCEMTAAECDRLDRQLKAQDPEYHADPAINTRCRHSECT